MTASGAPMDLERTCLTRTRDAPDEEMRALRRELAARSEAPTPPPGDG